MNTLNFNKLQNGLVPAIIKDWITGDVLMLGFMNVEAYEKTKTTKRVTFFSRSKNRLWTKGESSGNYLDVIDMITDCDNDTLLILARPHGPTCHNGTQTCFNDEDQSFLSQLESTIQHRKDNLPDKSYVASLFKKGVDKIAQKVGEEAVELVIESKNTDDDLFLNEAADLLFHYLILLKTRDKSLSDVVTYLKNRENK